MHLLLFLHAEDRFLTPERIDEIICTELPSQAQDPNGELRQLIGTSMVHSPCGPQYPRALCLYTIPNSLQAAKTKYSKHFPKLYQEATMVQADGYPIY